MYYEHNTNNMPGGRAVRSAAQREESPSPEGRIRTGGPYQKER